jgi:phosphoglycolate phosphatase-like HAD superfamily hydrolase
MVARSRHVTGDPDHPIGHTLGAAFDAMYVALVSPSTAPLFPGIHPLLSHLSSGAGPRPSTSGTPVLLGALSNACGAYVRAVLDVNGIAPWFRVALGADEVPAAKPRPEGLLRLCEALGVPPSACVYVSASAYVCV